MTWSINASGSKSSALESLKGHTQTNLFDGSAEKADYEKAKAHVIEKLEGAPDNADVSVSCSGHGTETDGKRVASSESLSISYWVPDEKK